MAAAGPCVFCEIVAHDREAFFIAQTEVSVAFLDARPLFAGHVLVVPRAHVPTLEELPVADIGAFFSEVAAITRAVRVGCNAAGTLVAANNRVSQSVPHLHVHVVPRNKGDGLRGFFWPRRAYRPGEAAQVADSIRLALGRDGA